MLLQLLCRKCKSDPRRLTFMLTQMALACRWFDSQFDSQHVLIYNCQRNVKELSNLLLAVCLWAVGLLQTFWHRRRDSGEQRRPFQLRIACSINADLVLFIASNSRPKGSLPLSAVMSSVISIQRVFILANLSIQRGFHFRFILLTTNFKN